MQHDTYKLCRADGTMERVRMPRVFNGYELAERMRHSLVFQYVPKGHFLFSDDDHYDAAEDRMTRRVAGPAWVWVTADAKIYTVPEEPQDDRHAYHMTLQARSAST